MVEIFGKAPRDLPSARGLPRPLRHGQHPAGDMGERYPLQGIDMGGRLGVIFSRDDYGDCWRARAGG